MKLPRRRWLFLAATIVAVAATAVVWYFDAGRTPDRFDDVRAGMTKQEVEAVVGRPSTVHVSARDKQSGEMRSGWAWHSQTRQMIVWFADDGSAQEVAITPRKRPSLRNRYGGRFGL